MHGVHLYVRHGHIFNPLKNAFIYVKRIYRMCYSEESIKRFIDKVKNIIFCELHII